MDRRDEEFFEEYKRLEKLCSEIFDCQNGVSEYIEQMENAAAAGSAKVSGWESDYRALKHVRWVRNKLAHESVEQGLSEEEDISFVKIFRERIMRESDPLTLLRKKSATTRKSGASAQKSDTVAPSEYDSTDSAGGCGKFIALFLIIAAIIALFLITKSAGGAL